MTEGQSDRQKETETDREGGGGTEGERSSGRGEKEGRGRDAPPFATDTLRKHPLPVLGGGTKDHV